jgi:hypothetical protein
VKPDWEGVGEVVKLSCVVWEKLDDGRVRLVLDNSFYFEQGDPLIAAIESVLGSPQGLTG